MGLGLKSKILIGVMACCLVGGAGSALALSRSGVDATGTAGAFDSAVYLYWGHESSSTTIAPVEDLAAGATQYRGLTVSPKSSKSVAGNVQISFTLAATGATNHLKGLTVSVYTIDAAFDEEHVEEQIDEKVASPVLDEGHLTGSVNLAIATNASVHETVGYYAIAVAWTGANDGEHPTYTLDATLTIAQAFTPAV